MEFGRDNEFIDNSVRWHEGSACLDADREQFYVSKVGYSDGDPLGLRDKYCGHCVVVDTCLAEAVERKDISATVVGGTTRQERKKLIRADLESKGSARRRDIPAVDPERIASFWQAATPEEKRAVDRGLKRKAGL
ncbi:MAG: WhiB family transcriptional regulator [Candidatus Saccharimonadales bacterium]